MNAIDWKQQLDGPVAVLYGGTSAEREISLQSGTAVYSALQHMGIESVLIDTAERSWLERVARQFRHCFIALHGINGEDGKVQAALELFGISYTGSGVLASALAMDKYRAKQLWQGIGLSTPEFVLLDGSTDWQQVIDRFGCVFVKPVSEGSSIGMSRVETAADLADAYQLACQYDSVVLAEQYINGSEYTVAILGDEALPAIKLETDHVFYDFDAKYLADDTRYLCPCGLSVDAEQNLNQLALAAFHSLGCSGWGRVDLMRDGEGKFFLLEVNTVPGMTSHSLVPMAALAAGLDFDALVARILQLSLVKP